MYTYFRPKNTKYTIQTQNQNCVKSQITDISSFA